MTFSPTTPVSATLSPSSTPLNFMNWEDSKDSFDSHFQQQCIQPLAQLSTQLKDLMVEEKQKLMNTDNSKLQLSQYELTVQQSVHTLTSILMKSADSILHQLDQCQQSLTFESSQITGLSELYEKGCDYVYHKKLNPLFFAKSSLNSSSPVHSPTSLTYLKEKVTYKDSHSSTVTTSPFALTSTMNTMATTTSTSSINSNSTTPSLSTLLSSPLIPTVMCPAKLNLNALSHIGTSVPSSSSPSKVTASSFSTTFTTSSIASSSNMTLEDVIDVKDDALHDPFPESEPIYAKVLYAYTPSESDEMELIAGEIIEIMNWDVGAGWALGKSTNPPKQGVFPRSYVQSME